jgi:bifunctional non-homologous end joining protein LigD
MAGSNWPTVEAQPMDSGDTLDLGGCGVDVFNVDRLVWPTIPKARLLEYYHAVSPYILPYLKDRPQSLHLKLTNANAPGLYIKEMEGRQPDCAEIFTDNRRHKEKGKRDQIDYLLCNNEATLLWMVNLGCIDINPWNSLVPSPDKPDYLVVDLDPTVKGGGHGYPDLLLDTAIAAKAYLDEHKIKAFAKTSGKTGMHFYIPCAGMGFPDARRVAEKVCVRLLTRRPNPRQSPIASASATEKYMSIPPKMTMLRVYTFGMVRNQSKNEPSGLYNRYHPCPDKKEG